MSTSPRQSKPVALIEAEPGPVRVDDDTELHPQARHHHRRRLALRRVDWRDDRGDISGVEILFSTVFLIALFLFICQVVVWWHTRNILEQAAAEGARAAATADASCAAAGPAAIAMADRMGGSWVESTDVSCAPGAIVVVVVTAETPMFGMPGSMHVEARATAPAEAGPGVAP